MISNCDVIFSLRTRVAAESIQFSGKQQWRNRNIRSLLRKDTSDVLDLTLGESRSDEKD